MMNKAQSMMFWMLVVVFCAAGCGDSQDGDPQTIRETGYISCQDGGDACEGGFNCENDDNELECVDAPEGCDTLTCDCIGEALCGDRGCHEDGGNVLCSPAPFDPCGGKACGEACSLCDPADEDCAETGEEKACDLDGECVSVEDPLTLCGEPQVCGGEGDLTCGAQDTCCVNKCCGVGQICCSGVPIPEGEGFCIAADQPGGCPQSLRSTKDEIVYVTPEQAERYSEQLRAVRLATWRYKAEPEGTPHRLGFIIEDAPGPHTILPDGGHVDLYGYTSLAVATLQVQAQQIDTLKTELETLRAEIKALRAESRR